MSSFEPDGQSEAVPPPPEPPSDPIEEAIPPTPAPPPPPVQDAAGSTTEQQAVSRPADQAFRPLHLGSGLILIGLGLAFLALRLRRG